MADRRLGLRNDRRQRDGDPLPNAVEPLVEGVALAFGQQDRFWKRHYRAYTLPRQVGRVVELVDDGRRFQDAREHEAVPVPEVGSVPKPRQVYRGVGGDEHGARRLGSQWAVRDPMDGDSKAARPARRLGVAGDRSLDGQRTPAVIDKQLRVGFGVGQEYPHHAQGQNDQHRRREQETPGRSGEGEGQSGGCGEESDGRPGDVVPDGQEGPRKPGDHQGQQSHRASTRSRTASRVAGPIPFTAVTSSTREKGPLDVR